MAIEIGNVLIGLGVLISAVTAILFKIKYIRSKCSSCLVIEKSFDKDLENAAKLADNTAIPRVIWPTISRALKKTLSPKEIKAAETVLETIETIGEIATESKNKQ